jgi:hypothetical protein
MVGDILSIEGWRLIDAKVVDDRKKGLIDVSEFVSFMWHNCEALMFEYRDEEDAETECEIRYLDAEDSVMGKCWYCQEAAPHDLHTVWTIHNMDIIHNIPDPRNDSWGEKYLENRIKDIETSKNNAREQGWYHG